MFDNIVKCVGCRGFFDRGECSLCVNGECTSDKVKAMRNDFAYSEVERNTCVHYEEYDRDSFEFDFDWDFDYNDECLDFDPH